MTASSSSLVMAFLGTDSHPFTSLVGWLDDYARERREHARVFVQHGSTPPPAFADGVPFLDRAEICAMLAAADVVVTHGGPASVFMARESGFKPIVVPRRPERSEHVDDHQVRFAEFLDRQDVAFVARDRRSLDALLDNALANGAAFRGVPRVADVASSALRLGEIIEQMWSSRRGVVQAIRVDEGSS